MEAQGKLIQLIDENGEFQKQNLENFINESSQFSRCGMDYHVISITGPQSSGKSTLLNSLFKCEFRVMNENYGRNQTTRGIQIAKSIRPCGVIIDTEGSDGKERGLDDTSFEKRSALFTLLISDIIILNMWHNDIGRANGSGLPLLQIIFQERMRLEDKQPPRPRKLLVILRDTDSENSVAEQAAMEQIKESVKQEWDSVAQQVGKNVPLAVYFELYAFPLPHYKYCRVEFDAKVAELRRQLSEPIATTVDRFPILGLSQGIEIIWTAIQNNEKLDVPSIRELVSIDRCRKIAKKMSESFKSREDYSILLEALDAGSLPNFRDEMVRLLDSCLQEYKRETSLYNKNVSDEYEKELRTELLKIMKHSYKKNIQHISNVALKLFKNSTTRSEGINNKMLNSLVEFEKKCEDCAIPNAGWSWSQVKQSLEHDMNNHQSEIFKIEVAKELESLDRCRKIAKKMSESFKSREDYNILSEALDAGSLPNFRDEMVHLLDSCLQEYNRETSLYNQNISAEYEKELRTELLEIMKCQYEKNIQHISNDALKLFKNSTTRSKEIVSKIWNSLVEFEKKCADCAIPNAGWSWSRVKQSLEHEMKNHQSEICKRKDAKKKKKIMSIIRLAITLAVHGVGIVTGVPLLGTAASLLMKNAIANGAEPAVQDQTEAVQNAAEAAGTSICEQMVDILDNIPL